MINWKLAFCQIWVWWWNNNTSFRFRLFPRKTNPKNPILRPRKIEFSWKKELCQFMNIPTIYHRAKNQIKNHKPYLRKTTNWRTDRQTPKHTQTVRQTDRQTERQIDWQTEWRTKRQADNGDFTGPSVAQGSENTKSIWNPYVLRFQKQIHLL